MYLFVDGSHEVGGTERGRRVAVVQRAGVPARRRQLRRGRHVADHHARGQRPRRVAQPALHGGGHQQHVRVYAQLVYGQLGSAVRHADVIVVRGPTPGVHVGRVSDVAGAEALG